MNTKEKELSEFEKIRQGLALKDSNVWPEKKKIKENKSFIDLCYEDFASRPKIRKVYGWIIVIMLIMQNALMACFIGLLAVRHLEELPKLQIFLSILLSGTLAETYFTFNYVVKWLFNDVDYKSFITIEK